MYCTSAPFASTIAAFGLYSTRAVYVPPTSVRHTHKNACIHRMCVVDEGPARKVCCTTVGTLVLNTCMTNCHEHRRQLELDSQVQMLLRGISYPHACLVSGLCLHMQPNSLFLSVPLLSESHRGLEARKLALKASS